MNLTVIKDESERLVPEFIEVRPTTRRTRKYLYMGSVPVFKLGDKEIEGPFTAERRSVINRSKYLPHQGHAEVARRRRRNWWC
jgi:hypothetical protein